MERRAWWATVHRVPKGRTGLPRLSMHARTSSKPPGRASPYRISSAATGLSPRPVSRFLFCRWVHLCRVLGICLSVSDLLHLAWYSLVAFMLLQILFFLWLSNISLYGLPQWLGSKEFTCKAGDVGLIPGLGRAFGEINGNPLRCSCLGNPMDRGAWWATVHGVAKQWDMT